MEGYVRFSLAHMLRMNLEPDRNRQVWREMVQCDLCVCVCVCVCVCACAYTWVCACVLPVGSNGSFYLV